MRAMGFQPRHIVGMVIGEGFVVALVGVVLGVAIGAPVVRFIGQWLEKQFGGWLANIQLQPGAIGLALAAAVLLGTTASALPAWRAGRLNIVDALRRVE
jgi:putative ABC transport system permease protein